MNSYKLRNIISLILISSSPCTIAEEEKEKLDSITVTAQKIERTLQETKESVAVITSEQIENTAILDINDIYNRSANVYDTGSGESFGIRGVSQTAVSTGGGSGELGSLYIDGVAFTGFSSRFNSKDLWDVGQVEILRGPQSTNVGRNALIGAVSVNTKQPDIVGFDAAARLEFGNFGRQSIETMFNVPVSNRSAFRITTEYSESDGFIENVTRNEDDFDARENLLIRAQYLMEVNEDLTFNIIAQHTQSERGQDLFRSDLQPVFSRISSANLPALEEYDASTLSFHLDYVINDEWSINSITSYLDGDYERFDDDDEGPEGDNAFRGRNAIDRNWAEEFRLNYSADRWQGVLGIYYTEVDLENNTLGLVNIVPNNVGVPEALLPFYPDALKIDTFSPFEETKTNIAFFTEWDYNFTDQTTLSFGFRYDHEEQDIFSNTSNSLSSETPLPDPVAAGQLAEQIQPGSGSIVEAGVTQVNGLLASQLIPTNFPRETKTYDAYLPQIGITHALNDGLNLSVFFKQGYRAGGVEISQSGQRSDYDPETLNNFEMALRSTLLDGDAYFNANIYYGDWHDQQVLVCLDNNIFNCATENAGESKIYGAEFDFQYYPSNQASVYASVGLSRTEFTRFISGTDGDLSGNEFAVSPKISASLGGKYYFDNRFYVSGNINYLGDMFADTQNNRPLDARTLVNMKVGYDFNQYNISLFAKNLFDKDYQTVSGLGLVDGTTLSRLGFPREFGVQIAYSY